MSVTKCYLVIKLSLFICCILRNFHFYVKHVFQTAQHFLVIVI